MTIATVPVPAASLDDERRGRANYEAFAAAVGEWMPAPPEWESLSPHVRRGWIAGAKAARDS